MMTPDLDTGLALILGGNVHVDCIGHRDSFEGTHIAGPDWDQIKFLDLL